MKKKPIPRELDKKSTKKLLERAGVALKNDFFMEAFWILSFVFERRIKRLIIKLEGKQKSTGYTFEQSIKRLKFLHISGIDPGFSAHFNLELIDKMRHWKNQRNTILKDMLEVHVSQARMERLAYDGIQLFKEWSKMSKSYRKTGRKDVSGTEGKEAAQ
jgi:hypothetical protein